MFTKKVVSLVMILAMLLTFAVVPATFAATNDVAETAAGYDYNLASSIQNGNILHAFNWKLSEITEYAPQIAAAGYTTVQISPIQQTKVTSNDGSYATDWWSFYQPTDMKIGNALGDEAALKTMCTELHKYGIKVIADVVTNHVQNSTSKSEASNVNATIRNTYLRRPGGQTNSAAASDSSRQTQVQNDMDAQLPDINTGNTAYQNYLITNLFTPMINAGVDGFRFDAAKHIETPDDGAYASQYWPNVVNNGIKKLKSDAYVYGEILASAGKFNISSYTKYINVTDYAYGATVRSALTSKNAGNLANYGYTGSSKNQNVLWLESHDNFCSNQSTSLNKTQQIQGWAIVGSRKDAPALFFVRPNCESLDSPGFIKYDEFMGPAGAASTWKDNTVVAVNQFKNAFAGQSESVSASGAMFYVQRGTTGMVIVNVGGGSTSVSQSCSMANGTYTDQVSGTSFTVSGGKISGKVGATGVAVIYNKTASNSAPVVTAKLGTTAIVPNTLVALNSSANANRVENRYTASTANVVVNLANASSGTVEVNGVKGTLKSGDNTIKLNSSIPYGTIVNVTVTATNGSKTVTQTYNITKKNASETKVAYFDNSNMKFPEIYAFCKTGEAASTKIAKYDAYKMTVSSGSIYTYTVPANTNYVKFNEGFIPNTANGDQYGRKHLFHSFTECQGYCGRTMPQTVLLYGDAKYASNRERGGYQIVGEMICSQLTWKDYLKTSAYTARALTASDVTVPGGSADPTEAPKPTQAPPTEAPKPTQAPPTEAPDPTSTPGTLIRGDADLNGKVTITDATEIQRHLADIIQLGLDAQNCSDVDGDHRVTIADVTLIQRALADLGNPYKVKEPISGTTITPTEAPEPTTAPEPTEPYEEPTSAPVRPDPKPLKNKFVAIIYCEASGIDDASRNSEHAFSTNGVLTYDFPGASYVFVRNDTGVQYCTDGWSNFANPVTLINEKNLTAVFDKMYVPAGTHTLYLTDNGNDTYTLGYDDADIPNVPIPSYGDDPTDGPILSDDVVYLNPNIWDKDGALFEAYFFDGSGGEEWVEMTQSGSNYAAAVPSGFSNVIFVRMDPNKPAHEWSSKWNQTADLSVSGNEGKTYTINGWGESDGSWG